MPVVAGIDPGKKGGLVAVNEENKIVGLVRVPVIKPKGMKERPNYPVMAQTWLPILKLCSHVYVEQVGSMPKQGVASSFNFGYVAGAAYGMILALGLAHTFITPQKWKKEVGISGSDGTLSIRRACQLFPESAEEFARVTVDEGVAEAALIGYAGRKLLGAV